MRSVIRVLAPVLTVAFLLAIAVWLRLEAVLEPMSSVSGRPAMSPSSLVQKAEVARGGLARARARPAASRAPAPAGSAVPQPRRPESSAPDQLASDVAAADEVIASAPDDYLAYKEKLVKEILLEVQYGRPTDPEVYDALLDEMIAFDVESETDWALDDLRDLGGGLGGDFGADPAPRGLDRDLIHLPFLRLSALGDYDGLGAMADEYIAAYPGSIVGYLYFAEAAWGNGDRMQALDVLRQGLGADASPETAAEILRQFTSTPPTAKILRMLP